jgi:protein SCO1/2
MRPRTLLVAVALVAFAAGGGIAALLLHDTGAARLKVLGRASVGGPFTLTDHTGRRVSDADFRGRHMLIYFGFTHCPDVCPGSLQVMSEALARLGRKADRVTPILITLDPERDSPQQLAPYVASFGPRLVGLTGSAQEIAAIARAYRNYYARSKDERATASYTIDHASLFFLMDANGAFVTIFRHGTSAQAMAEQLDKLL